MHGQKSEALIAFEQRLVRNIAARKEQVLRIAESTIPAEFRSYIPQPEVPYIITSTNYQVLESKSNDSASAAAADVPVQVQISAAVTQEHVIDSNVLHGCWKNAQETYLDYCVKQSQLGKQPLSESDYLYHQRMTQLIQANMHELTKSEACADLLKGFSQEAQGEIIGTAVGIVMGGAVYGVGVAIGTVAPPAVPAYYLSLAIASAYKSSGAVYHNGQKFVQALRQDNFEAAGKYGTRTILDTIGLVDSTKAVGMRSSAICSGLKNRLMSGFAFTGAQAGLLGNTPIKTICPKLVEKLNLGVENSVISAEELLTIPLTKPTKSILQHIMIGDWNAKKKQVSGFHHAHKRPEWIHKIIKTPDAKGVYVASVVDRIEGKAKMSTCVPKGWTLVQHKNAILSAYNNPIDGIVKREGVFEFTGKDQTSGIVFTIIVERLSDNSMHINTAYPVYNHKSY